LHLTLEAYRVPKYLHSVNFSKISPIFRDVTELTAHHSLSEKIKEAVLRSCFLIVLCSPASKNSHWVNEEIKLFREIHGENSILCALIEGGPQTSFPPALLEGGREPLAADLRPQAFRLGVSQLAASILGVGLDELVQRDLKKMRRRVMAVTASAAAALLVMGTLTWTAIDARKLAEQRRVDAEGQIEFMLTDLKDKLDEVGRLDALNAVGEKAARYYDGYGVSEHDDDALGRRARVFHHLGEIQRKLGNLTEADIYFENAFKSTLALTKREPNNPQRIFEHAQSSFWVGYNLYGREAYSQAKPYFESYLDAATKLDNFEAGSDRAASELSYAHTNLGAVERGLGNLEESIHQYNKAMVYKKKLFDKDSTDKKRLFSLSNAYGHLAGIQILHDDMAAAVLSWEKAYNLVSNFESTTEDAAIAYKKLHQLRSLAKGYYLMHDTEKAAQALREGQRIASDLLAIDPNNVNVKYENLLLGVLEFELAYLKAQKVEAKNVLALITANMLELPSGFRDTSRYRGLENNVALLTLYFAISESDDSKIQVLARERLQSLKDAHVTSGADLLNHPSGLKAAILLHEILRDEYTEGLLWDVCKNPSPHIGYQKKVILSTVFEVPSCGVLKGMSFKGQHITHAALSYLK